MGINLHRRPKSESDLDMQITSNAIRFARRQWPRKLAANLAAVLRISERQAERLTDEKRPWALRHIGKMTVIFGLEFVTAVFHPLAAREAHAEHIAVREHLARQRAANETARILAREASASAGRVGGTASLAVRAAGAAGRLIARMARRSGQNVGAL